MQHHDSKPRSSGAAANGERFDWRGVFLDAVIIISITALTALRLANLYVFLAVVGPLVGARLAAVRASAAAAMGGSLLVLVGLGLWNSLRRLGS